MNQNVIVAVDHSVQAENAVKYYLEKMHRPGNKLILVHCIDLPELSLSNARECHVSPAVLAGMWKEEELKCKALEEKMKSLVKDKKVSARLRSCTGKPGDMVCRVAAEEHAAFIVTAGAHSISAVKRKVLGSVTDHIVRHAQCPVIICRDIRDIERQRRRHSSTSAALPKPARIRRSSESAVKVRHRSGEALTTFASSLRRRFSSTGSQSFDEGRDSLQCFGTTTILYSGLKNLTVEDEAKSGDEIQPSTADDVFQPAGKTVEADIEQ